MTFIMFFICIILLLYFPKMLLLSLFIVCISIIVKYIINLHPLTTYIDGNYKVVNKIKMGSIIKVDGQNVLIRSKVSSNIGDVIAIKGQISEVLNTKGFDIVSYLKTKHIASQIYPSELTINETSKSFFVKTHEYIRNGPIG